jgi:adenylate cyclase class 2
MAGQSIETEIKLAVPGADIARRRLEDAGFRQTRPRTFESNTVWDTPAGSLRAGAQLLRLREFGGLFILTYKGPPAEGRHKSREEIELAISDPAALAAILTRLGFQPRYHYEKYRSEFRLSGEAGLATLDETPCGVFLELEGSSAWIDTTAQELGFTPEDYILLSYLRLWEKHASRHGLDPARMVFRERQD